MKRVKDNNGFVISTAGSVHGFIILKVTGIGLTEDGENHYRRFGAKDYIHNRHGLKIFIEQRTPSILHSCGNPIRSLNR